MTPDGGGVRGYITASVLKKLVETDGVGDFLTQVTLRAGTSTGSFIALGLAGGIPPTTILEQYQPTNAAKIFTPRAPRTIENELTLPWYDNSGASTVAQQLLGSSTKLSDLRSVLVNTLQLDYEGRWRPLSINNLASSGKADMLAYEAALCSGSAPIYFPPFSPSSSPLGYCVDGGLFANNPSLAAIACARAEGALLDDMYVLSLDTGTPKHGISPQIIQDNFGGPRSTGLLDWFYPVAVSRGDTTMPSGPLLSAIMESSAAAISQQAASLLGGNYFRVSVPLAESVALDDTSPAAYRTMDAALNTYFMSDDFNQVLEWLRTNVPATGSRTSGFRRSASTGDSAQAPRKGAR